MSSSLPNRPNVAPNRAQAQPLRRAIWLTIVLSLYAGHAPAVKAADSETTQANKELSAVVERLNALKRWFNEAEEKRSRWAGELKKADTAVAKLGLRVVGLTKAQGAIESRLTTLSDQSRELAKKRATEERTIAEHLNAAYRMSGQDFFKLLMNQEHPQDLDRMIRYHQYFSAARSETLADYQATLAAIAKNSVQAAAERDNLVEQKAKVAGEQKAFLAQRSERERLLAQLDEETKSHSAEQAKLEADRNRLQELLAVLAERATQLDGQEFLERQGNLPWPSVGELTHKFGQARAEGRLRWQGNYYTTNAGAPIRAVHRGKVVFAEWLRGFGLLTIVDHGDGYMSLYGYADVLLKRPGDWVESGEPIANSGRSGGQTADGVYFEIRKSGKAVDPGKWLVTQATQ